MKDYTAQKNLEHVFAQNYKSNPTEALIELHDEAIRSPDYFRAAIHWLGEFDAKAAIKLIPDISWWGNYGDLYCLIGTLSEDAMWAYMKWTLECDLASPDYVSDLAKYLKSENTSSKESCELGTITRKHLGMNSKKYRKTLSYLRAKIRENDISKERMHA